VNRKEKGLFQERILFSGKKGIFLRPNLRHRMRDKRKFPFPGKIVSEERSANCGKEVS